MTQIATSLAATAPIATAQPSISEPMIQRYFETLAAQDFEATTALFAEQGILYAPFETAIVGRSAILDYLQQEAVGVVPQPETIQQHWTGNQDLLYEVRGRVQMPLFGVNVAWVFCLNPNREILAVTVKLLASPQELLKLRSS